MKIKLNGEEGSRVLLTDFVYGLVEELKLIYHYVDIKDMGDSILIIIKRDYFIDSRGEFIWDEQSYDRPPIVALFAFCEELGDIFYSCDFYENESYIYSWEFKFAKVVKSISQALTILEDGFYDVAEAIIEDYID